ncbi:MAG: Bax inhibitor-1/YccA family protein [Bacteroidaceae bacterium]|nr:Bax inhibitor-1/YccA family protein [Bacteroidaceae bacterium]
MDYSQFNQMVNERENIVSRSFPAVMKKVYTWMTLALAITGMTAWLVASSPAIMATIFSNSILFWGLLLGELGLVIWLSAGINKMSLTTATLLFIAYSVVNGLTMSFIFLAYTASSIATTFFITAGTFGAMSLFGYTTGKDLSGMGKILFMALIGLIIATIVNIFVGNGMMDMIISYAGVLIFVGLTAYDTQKIKQMFWEADEYNPDVQKYAVLGALTLYLDFINLFLYLLRIFGRRD